MKQTAKVYHSSNNHRIAIYAHYDAQDRLRPFVLRYLKSIRDCGFSVIFVTTSNLTKNTLCNLDSLVKSVYVEPNIGFDFMMWSRVINTARIKYARELLLTNSSIFGPSRPLDEIFLKMSGRGCDFWGLTENMAPRRHIQSYFLVFRERTLAHPAFQQFWSSVLPYRTKWQTILSYELGLTQFLEDNGLKSDALIRWSDITDRVFGKRWPLQRRNNPTYTFADTLLDMGMPFVKVEAVRGVDHEHGLRPMRRGAEYIRKKLLLAAMKRHGFAIDEIELDRTASLGW